MKTIIFRFITVLLVLVVLIYLMVKIPGKLDSLRYPADVAKLSAVDSVNNRWEKRMLDTLRVQQERLNVSVAYYKGRDSISSIRASKLSGERNYYRSKYLKNKTINNCDSALKVDSALLAEKDTSLIYKQKQINDLNKKISLKSTEINVLSNKIERKELDNKLYMANIQRLNNDIDVIVKKNNSFWNKNKTKLSLVTGFVAGGVAMYYIRR